MYGNGTGPSPNQQPQQQGQQPARHWDPNDPNQQHYQQGPPLNGQYPPSRPSTQPPASSQSALRPDRPEMATLHAQPGYQPPPPEGMYRLPPSSAFYQPQPPPQEQYRPQPAQQGSMGQSAPRQRTAIACKYCRRRKIRCSGFENSEDGRCSNCIRFSQECVFTPVSAQTQAFVPAQALYRSRGGPPTQLYGAYGQRLPPQAEGYAPHPQGAYTLPTPHAQYPPPPHGQPYPPPPQAYQQAPYDPNSRRRPNNEPHTPTLPHPNSGHGSHMGGRPEDAPGYAYPDPSGYASAGVSPVAANPYQGGPQPYYAPQQARRNSPNSVYSYEQQGRESSSPHGSANYGYAPGHPQPPPAQSAAPTPAGRTPPPQPGNGSRAGLSIHDITSDNGNSSGERSAADSDMVSALNRAPRRPDRQG